MRPLNVEDAKGTTHARDTLIHTDTQTDTHKHTHLFICPCMRQLFVEPLFMTTLCMCVRVCRLLCIWLCESVCIIIMNEMKWENSKGRERQPHCCGAY